MESFGRVLSSGVGAALAALSPFGVENDDSAVDAELPDLATPDAPADELHEDWLVVTEDHAVVRTVPITDIHTQRTCSHPQPIRLWDLDDNSDVLIEQPLVESPHPRVVFGSVSYATVVQASTLDCDSVATAADEPPTPAVDAQSQFFYEIPTYTRVGRHHGPPPSRAAAVLNGDIADWLDMCKSDRVTRRFMSRQHRLKIHSKPRASAKKRS
mmetsp:Transcript_16398/g.22966  ORF Transcript_16398/g.22966 Transcript_16398/m.22966 type:complete len:213 (-) Transcript_16398:159-797(-)